MKKNNKIDENGRLEMLKLTIWFNLFIGIYNLYVFNELNSLFHLVLGSLNVGVWVFYREKFMRQIYHLRSIHKDRMIRKGFMLSSCTGQNGVEKNICASMPSCFLRSSPSPFPSCRC